MSREPTNTAHVSDDRGSQRALLIQTVQTPLGFFALVVLVVEAILGVVASITTGTVQVLIVSGMLLIISSLIGIVAYLSYSRPEALKGTRPLSKISMATPGRPAPTTVRVKKVYCVLITGLHGVGRPDGVLDPDIEILRRYFPRVTCRVEPSIADFRKDLSTGKYEILHLLGHPHPDTGAIRFQDGDLSAQGLLKLLELCGAQLAFLATCSSLVLAARLAPEVTVIGSAGAPGPRSGEWTETFYRMLASGYSVSHAYEIAQAVTNVPMVLLSKRDLVLAM